MEEEEDEEAEAQEEEDEGKVQVGGQPRVPGALKHHEWLAIELLCLRDSNGWSRLLW